MGTLFSFCEIAESKNKIHVLDTTVVRRGAMLRPVAGAWPTLILGPKNNIKVLVAGASNWPGHTLAGAHTGRGSHWPGLTLTRAHIPGHEIVSDSPCPSLSI